MKRITLPVVALATLVFVPSVEALDGKVYPATACMPSHQGTSEVLSTDYVRFSFYGQANQANANVRLAVECPGITANTTSKNGLSQAKVFFTESGEGPTRTSCTLEVYPPDSETPAYTKTKTASVNGDTSLDLGATPAFSFDHARYNIICQVSRHTYLYNYRLEEK